MKYEIHTSQRLFQVESRILQGPRSDLSSFMTAFDKLDLAITFLQKHRYYLDPFLKVTNVCPMLTSTVRLVAQCCRSLSTAEDALRHATDLQKDGLRLCQEEFITVLKGNLQEPNAARLVQSSFPSQDVPVAGTQLPSLCLVSIVTTISQCTNQMYRPCTAFRTALILSTLQIDASNVVKRHTVES